MDTVSDHNNKETEQGAPPEELAERKTGSSNVMEEKEEQYGAQTWPWHQLGRI